MDFSILISSALGASRAAPARVGLGLIQAQTPLGKPKDGIWVLGEIPAWLDQIISFNPIIPTPRAGSASTIPKMQHPKEQQETWNKAQRKILLLSAHSLIFYGDLGFQRKFWRSNIQPHNIQPSWIFHLFTPWLSTISFWRFAALTELFLPKQGRSERLEFNKELFPWDWNEGIVGSSQPLSPCSTSLPFQCPRRIFMTQSLGLNLGIPSLYPFCGEHF